MKEKVRCLFCDRVIRWKDHVLSSDMYSCHSCYKRVLKQKTTKGLIYEIKKKEEMEK